MVDVVRLFIPHLSDGIAEVIFLWNVMSATLLLF